MAAPGTEKRNVAIFDDFISSNNTDDDFDEITATLGDVDAYIEHQRQLQSERGGKRGGKGGKSGGGGKDAGKQEGKGDGENEGGAGGRGGGRGGRGGGEGGRGGKGGKGGRGGGEAGREEGADGEGGGKGGRGGRGGEGGGRGGKGGRGGQGGGRGGGKGEGGRGGDGGEGRRDDEGLRQRKVDNAGGKGKKSSSVLADLGLTQDDMKYFKAHMQKLREENNGADPNITEPILLDNGTKITLNMFKGLQELKNSPKGGKGKGGKGGKGGQASLKGVAVLLGGCFCMSASMTTTKLAVKQAPVVQIRFFRSLINLVLAYIYANKFKGKSVAFQDLTGKKSIALRVGMTVFQTFSQMYVARKLPLGLSAALMGLTPVTTSVMGYIILGTYLPISQWMCVFTTVIGVFLISQPAMIFGESVDTFEEYDVERYIAIGLAILMAVARSMIMILNKKLVEMGEGRAHMSVITFYNNLAASILCLILLPLKGNVGYKILELPSTEAMGLIVLGSILFFGRPMLMEIGGAKLPQSLMVVLRSSSVIWAFVFQLCLFAEIPTMMEAAGISVIVGCATVMYKLTGSE